MPTVVCKYSGDEHEFEYDEFMVEDDPNPPGRWKVWYKCSLADGYYDYWVILPKKNDEYLRVEEVRDRDLTCEAIGMTCERLQCREGPEGYPIGIAIERMATEPRLPSLTALAIQIERSRAMLLGRQPRNLISIAH